MKLKKLILGFYNVNCYIISSDEIAEKLCFIIDPGADFNSIEKYLYEEKLNPGFILNTHGHYDHIAAVPELTKKYNIPFFIHNEDADILIDPGKNMSSLLGSNKLSLKSYQPIKEKEVDFFSRYGIQVFHMPGHTPGSIIIKVANFLFTGDLLFRGGVGRTDLPGGSQDKLLESLKSLMEFDPSLAVYPGHGANSSLEYEFENNYYLSPDFLEGGTNWY